MKLKYGMLGLSIVAIQTLATAQAQPGLPRNSIHGMVIYGKGPKLYLLDHIPMLMTPHNEQIVAEVEITKKNGKPLDKNLSDATYTLPPATQFSLDRYIKGDVKEFNGTIYSGSFEDEVNGAPIEDLDNVKVRVVKILFDRPLPNQTGPDHIDFVDPAARDAGPAYRINVIKSSSNIHSVTRLSDQKSLWCVLGPHFGPACEQ